MLSKRATVTLLLSLALLYLVLSFAGRAAGLPIIYYGNIGMSLFSLLLAFIEWKWGDDVHPTPLEYTGEEMIETFRDGMKR